MSLKKRAWLTLGAVVLGGAGAVTIAVANPDSSPAERPVTARPASTKTLDLKQLSSAKEGLPQQETTAFSAVSVSWQGETAPLEGTAQVRTKSAESGDWSDWQTLPEGETETDDAEGTVRGGSDLLWTGPADGVEARVVAEDGTVSDLPEDLKLHLIDPGVAPREATAAGGTAADLTMETAAFSTQDTAPDCDPPTAPGTYDPLSPAPASTVVKPPMINRAAWGARTTIECPVTYAPDVKGVIVHHTAFTASTGVTPIDQNYSCANSATIVRTVQALHMDTRDYNDIGYNFLVDKCGRIFEGRGGGVDQPVIGAHDVGFNTGFVGISYLGNFEVEKPTKAAMESIARIAAWKLGQFGLSPTSTATFTSGKDDPGSKYQEGESVTLPRIFGHRDTFATACPGKNLYPQLGKIRTLAAAKGVSHALDTTDLRNTTGAAADGRGDLVVGLPKSSSSAGAVAVLPGGENGPLSANRLSLTQNSTGVSGSSESGDQFGASTAVGDLNGDGVADLVVGSPGENLGDYSDSGNVTWMFGPGLNTSGASGGSQTGAKLGSTVAVGDFNADGKADIFSAGTGNSGTYWVRDMTTGAMTGGTVTTATGAISFPSATSGDFDRDGYADVVLSYRDQGLKGRLLSFKGSAAGLVKGSVLATPGGRSVASGDINGDLIDDLVVGQPYGNESTGSTGGQITTLQGATTGWTSSTVKKVVHQDTTGVTGGSESGDAMGQSVSVGDVNGDMYADVLVGAPREDLTSGGSNRVDAGMAWLFKGSSTGLTTSGWSWHQDSSGIGGGPEAYDRFGSGAVLADLSGYARTDIAIGVDGEDTNDGVILQLDAGSTGISNSGGVYYGKAELGAASDLNIGTVLAP